MRSGVRRTLVLRSSGIEESQILPNTRRWPDTPLVRRRVRHSVSQVGFVVGVLEELTDAIPWATSVARAVFFTI